MHNIMICGRSWFDRRNGCAYCSCTIYIDGALRTTLPMECGYGDYYLQRAGEWLDAHDLIEREHYANGGSEPLHMWAIRAGVVLSYECAHVARNSDLH